MASAGERVVLRGRAKGVGVLAWWSRLKVGEKTHVATHGSSFVIATEHGDIEVNLPASMLEHRLVAPSKRRCAWEDLDEASRKHHDSLAPGPGEKVELTRAEIRDGDDVTVSGDVTAIGPKTSGYREGESSISAIDAVLIGAGDSGNAAVMSAVDAASAKPRAPIPWLRILAIGTRIILTLPLVMLVVRVLAGIGPSRVELVWPGVLGLSTVGVFATSYRALRISSEDDVESQFGVPLVMPLFATMLVGFVSATAAWGDGPGKNANSFVSWLLAGTGLVLGGFASVAYWRAIRFRGWFTAKPDWSVTEGTAETELKRNVKSLSVSGEWRFTIAIAGVVRCTEDFDSSTSGSGRGATTYHHHKIPVGGRVLVAGRFEPKDTKLAVRGPGSLVLFGCGPNESPRALLDAHVRRLSLVVVQSAIPLLVTLYCLTRS